MGANHHVCIICPSGLPSRRYLYRKWNRRCADIVLTQAIVTIRGTVLNPHDRFIRYDCLLKNVVAETALNRVLCRQTIGLKENKQDYSMLSLFT